jgi:hypothetical protein
MRKEYYNEVLQERKLELELRDKKIANEIK